MPRLRRTSAAVLATPCMLALALLAWRRSPTRGMPWQAAPTARTSSQPVRLDAAVQQRHNSSLPPPSRSQHARPRFPPHGLFEGGPGRPVSADSLQCHAFAGDEEGSTKQACLPLVLGISCVHCGSSSLAAYLNAHPQLSYGARKEHHFFPDRSNSDRSARLLKYSEQFLFPIPPQAELGTYGLDFTPGYLSKSAMDKRVISQVAELPAETRFIVIIKSAKEFMQGRLREKATFKCLEDRQCWQEMRRLCCQHIQLEPWLAQFDRQRFFFVRSGDLAKLSQRQSILDEIAKWLGISQYTYPDKVLRYKGNVGMSQRTRDHDNAKAVAAGDTTAHEHSRSASGGPESEEEQVMDRGLGDCDASLAELLGGWDLSNW